MGCGEVRRPSEQGRHEELDESDQEPCYSLFLV